jgi:hypothetical protein
MWDRRSTGLIDKVPLRGSNGPSFHGERRPAAFPAGGVGHSNRATNFNLPVPTFILMIMRLT